MEVSVCGGGGGAAAAAVAAGADAAAAAPAEGGVEATQLLGHVPPLRQRRQAEVRQALARVGGEAGQSRGEHLEKRIGNGKSVIASDISSSPT